MKHYLSESDRERIATVVASGEEKTGCEFVTVITPSSGKYSAVLPNAGILGVILTTISCFLLGIWTDFFTSLSSTTLLLFSVTCGLCFLWIPVLSPFVRRLLIGKSNLHDQSLLYAKESFLRNEVFNTTYRTGIHIYISVFERKIHITADSGLDDIMSDEDWQKVILHATPALKLKTYSEAIIACVNEATILLLQKSDLNIPDSLNELPNDTINE